MTAKKEKITLPECWNDDERMDYLFSAFHGSTNNNDKYQFWSKLIVDVCCQCQQPSLHFSQIKEMVKRDDRYPLGLNQIIAKLIEDKQLVPRTEFLQSCEEVSWLSWGTSLLLKRPLGWMARKLAESLQLRSVDGDLQNERLVCISSLERKNKKLLELLNDSVVEVEGESSQILSWSLFIDKVREVVGDNDDINLMIKYCKRMKHITVAEAGSANLNSNTDFSLNQNQPQGDTAEKFVKFVSSGQSVVASFTEVERSSMKLLSTCKMLQSENACLRSEKKELELEIRALVRKGEKRQALPILRRVKKLDKQIDDKEKALVNVDTMLDQIKQCKSDAIVMGTYRTANNAIKDLMNESGLTVDETEKVMASVNDTLSEQDEISTALSAPVVDENLFDDDELEAEFTKLVIDDKLPQMSDKGPDKFVDLPDFIEDSILENFEKNDKNCEQQLAM